VSKPHFSCSVNEPCEYSILLVPDVSGEACGELVTSSSSYYNPSALDSIGWTQLEVSVYLHLLMRVFLLCLPMEPRLGPHKHPNLMGPISNLVTWYELGVAIGGTSSDVCDACTCF
jgi:hypothetical protein